jgi:hypothetical protein
LEDNRATRGLHQVQLRSPVSDRPTAKNPARPCSGTAEVFLNCHMYLQISWWRGAVTQSLSQ